MVERGIAATQVILRSLFRSREGAVLLRFAWLFAFKCPLHALRTRCRFVSEAQGRLLRSEVVELVRTRCRFVSEAQGRLLRSEVVELVDAQCLP